MSGPTIRISDDMGGFPDVSASSDIGTTVEINDINDFDLGLLGNHKKMANTTPQSASPAPLEMKSDIEFVNLEDTAVRFDLKPPVNVGGANDTIRILRDSGSSSFPAALPINSAPSLSLSGPPAPAPVPVPAPSTGGGFKSWFGMGSSAPAPAPDSGSGGGFKSWFGTGSPASASAAAPVDGSYTETYLTPEQETAKKTEGLTMLERMDRKGIGGTKMTMANSLDEINAEVARRKDSKGLEASIRFQRSLMTTVTNGMEFLNNKYDPFGLALDGWSESVNENVEDYDEIFEELYDKYKDKSKVAPEIRLVMTLGLSAAMCHVTNTMFKSRMPGMDEILRKNPDLANKMARAAAEQAVGPGFANFVSLGMPSRPSAPPVGASMQSMAAAAEAETDDLPFMPPMGSGFGGAIPTLDPRGSVAPAATARREMRGPTGVEDILRKLDAAGEMPSRAVPPPAASSIETDEMGSVISGMTTDTMRRSGISRRRKATTTQPTGATLTLNV